MKRNCFIAISGNIGVGKTDSEIFADNLYRRGLMSKRDFDCYHDVYEAMNGILRYPDLLIYLRASIGVLLNRIQKRGRVCEKRIDKEYLLQLNMAYDRWAKKMQQFTQVIIIDTDELDIFKRNKKLQEIMQSIECLIQDD